MSSPAQLRQDDVEERNLTFIDKVNIAQHLLNNQNWSSIAERFGTSLVKVQQLSENVHVVLETFRYFLLSQQMPLRSGLYPRMESVLFYWYGEQNGNVTNKALGDKAKQIIEVLNERPTQNSLPFNGSNSWANKFRARYSLPTTTRHKTMTANTTVPNNVDADAALNATVYAAILNAAVLNAAVLNAASSNSTSMHQGHQEADDVVYVSSDDENAPDAQLPGIKGTGLRNSGQNGEEVKFKTEVEDFQVKSIPSAVIDKETLYQSDNVGVGSVQVGNVCEDAGDKTVQLSRGNPIAVEQSSPSLSHLKEVSDDDDLFKPTKKRKRPTFTTGDDPSDERSDSGDPDAMLAKKRKLVLSDDEVDPDQPRITKFFSGRK